MTAWGSWKKVSEKTQIPNTKIPNGQNYFVIFVGTFMLPLYAINLGVARLFTDSPFSVFSNLEFYNDLCIFFQFECVKKIHNNN
jgi:TRAP-type C4-dicarboxylate transport system permease small subunit